MHWSRYASCVIAASAGVFLLSGCFDWNVPDDYVGGGDGDGDSDSDSDGDSDGDRGHGELCSQPSDCQAGHLCSAMAGDPGMVCRRDCAGGASCEDLGPTSICLQGWDSGGNACTESCDIFRPNCPSGSHCTFVPIADTGRAGTVCALAPGGGGEGATCETQSDCNVGFHCADFGRGPMCARYCPTPGENNEVCTHNLCVHFDPQMQLLDGRPLGVCIPFEPE
jgi:hypothetical protein